MSKIIEEINKLDKDAKLNFKVIDRAGNTAEVYSYSYQYDKKSNSLKIELELKDKYDIGEI